MIAEMVRLESQLRKAILAKADLDELEALLMCKGHTSMLADGERLVSEGITTREELNKVCGIASDYSWANGTIAMYSYKNNYIKNLDRE